MPKELYRHVLYLDIVEGEIKNGDIGSRKNERIFMKIF